MLLHAGISDAVIAVSTYVWWLKSKGEGAAWMVIVEGLLAMGVVVVGGIGGTLTYNFGVGMSLGVGGGKKGQ